MRDIKHLPETVRSSVRSGIVLFNLTRVVEELIFNSLDARATKVSVAVGVGTHYIKVVDNGCGITWDGLVLLGERYEGISFDLFSKNSLGSLQSLFGIYFTTNQFGGSISNLARRSEDELFCTTPSSSPLSLLTSGFGIEIFSSLHELNVSDGVLKLSGYMSSPRDTSFVKACQFVCIREVDYLVSVQRFNSSDLQEANMKLQNGKRSRSQTYETYILNLSCPRSWYDITFEPSKTSVEFKGNSSSRGTVMSEEDNTWREGNDVSSPEKDLPEKYEIAKRRCRMYNHRASFGLLSPQLEMPTEESDHMFHWKDNRFSCQDASEHQIRLGSLYQTDCSFQLCDGLLAPSRVTVNQKSASYRQATDHSVFSSEDHFLGNKFFGEKRSSEHTDYILGSRLEDAHFNVDASISNGFKGSALSPDCFEIGDDVDKISEDLKPFLHNCSCRRSLPVDGASPASSEGFDFRINGFGAKRKSLEPNDWVCVGEIDDNNQRFDFLPGTLWQDEAASAWSSPGPMSKCDVLTGLDFLSRDSIESSAIGGECLAGENDLPPDSIARVGKFFSSRQSLKSEWSSVMSDPLFRTKSQNVDNFFDENALERHCTLNESHDPLDSGLKWQKSCLRTAKGDKLHNLHNESNILDVSSGILHLAGDSLVPESINKNCLEDAKVLQQVDKKFIPIVGGGVLAIIDQDFGHAADERIHLEELRQKVLSGEMKTVTYLDTEQKLVLPEIGYQLLHNYADQIQNWGWLCNICSLGSRSFKKQPTIVTLNACAVRSVSRSKSEKTNKKSK
ncbi:unnamed protein product [Camellia sinensis]